MGKAGTMATGSSLWEGFSGIGSTGSLEGGEQKSGAAVAFATGA